MIAAAFGAWRLARMIVEETGPFAIFERVRYEIAIRTRHGGWVDEGMGCVLCVSFWTSLVFAAITRKRSERFVVRWLGIAGMAAAINLLLERE